MRFSSYEGTEAFAEFSASEPGVCHRRWFPALAVAISAFAKAVMKYDRETAPDTALSHYPRM